jgi:N utilization substance protein B
MGPRREGRELAVKALYQLELTGDPPEAALLRFWADFSTNEAARAFGRRLVEGVGRERERIDRLIADAAEHWRITRLSKVDAAVLRVGVYELMACADIPARVTMDEAIEIARRFGSEDSGTFVNGVLDRVAEVLGVKGKGEVGCPTGEGRQP